MKNRLEILIALLLLAPLAALQAAEVPRSSKPNIILIYTDDHGYSDLGCMGIMKDVKTPNIDALASGGVRMTSGYVTAPQCSPSRCGVISGQYQGKFGMDHNGMLESDPTLLERFRALNNLPKRLKQAGYVTGMAGKSHLGSNDSAELVQLGFDKAFFKHSDAPGHWNIADNGAPLKMMPHAFVTDSNGLKTLKHDTPSGWSNWDGSLNDPMNGEKGMLTEGGIRLEGKNGPTVSPKNPTNRKDRTKGDDTATDKGESAPNEQPY